MAGVNGTKTRVRADWAAVKLEYRANVLSNRQIADRHHVSEGAIRKRAKEENWVRDLSSEIRDVAEDMVRKSEVRSEVRSERGVRTAQEKEVVIASAKAIAEQKQKTRKQLGLTQQIFDGVMTELMAETGDVESLANLGKLMAAPDESGRDKLNEAYLKAISLPSRVLMLKTATEAMKNMQTVSRIEYKLDTTPDPSEAAKALGEGIVKGMSEASKSFRDDLMAELVGSDE